jgi:hypothetical protein
VGVGAVNGTYVRRELALPNLISHASVWNGTWFAPSSSSLSGSADVDRGHDGRSDNREPKSETWP